MRRLLSAVLAWCATLPAYAADRPTPQEMLRDWYYLMNELVRHTATYSPPVASRSFGYLGVTAFEAAVGGSDKLVSLVGQLHGLDSVPAREAGAVYDETIIISAAMSDAIVYYFGNTGPTGLRAIKVAQTKWRARAVDGVPDDVVVRSEAFGKAMAASIHEWSLTMAARSSPIWGSRKNGICPRAKANGCRPARSASSSCRCCPTGATTAPLPCPRALPARRRATRPSASNPTRNSTRRPSRSTRPVKNATPEQMAIARFWSDDPMLSMTPPGHWVSIALQVAERANLSLDDNVDLLARMGVAMSDAFVGCWHAKYVYNLIRPITYIKKVIDPKWEPILNTPPFPEYPSGHSTVSGAMDAVLTAFFGENYAFEDKTGSPDGRNPRNYKSFHEAAEEAGISRLYGGIHFRSAIVDGLAQGRCIGEYTNALKTRK